MTLDQLLTGALAAVHVQDLAAGQRVPRFHATDKVIAFLETL